MKITQPAVKKGFTLPEIIIGSTVFAIIAISVFQTYSTFINLVSAGKYKILAADLMNEQFELIRNLSYKDVGVQNSIPNGVLAQNISVTRSGVTFEVTRTIRNIDDPFDGTIGGSPNDLSPGDSKLVQIDIECPNCKNFIPVSASTRVAPKNLETASNNGALFVKAFDANGVGVPQADVHITYIGTTTNITIDDITNNSGVLQIVDAPPGVKTYRITVTKDGYTTDRTYATSSGNPNPAKPDATVVNQQVTQSSFIIDKVSTATIKTLDTSCGVIPNVTFNLKGSKLIGASPDVLKYNQNFSTDSSGLKSINNLEWDTFDVANQTSSLYIAGTNPALPFSILPNSSQTINLVMTSEPANHLLVVVSDSATGLPISGATLTLTKSESSQVIESGRGYLEQTDWSGGSGQANFSNETKFWSTDGNIAINNPAGDLKLVTSLGTYVSQGEIMSSIFDTGTSSNFGNIFWSPISQPSQAGTSPIKFQIATSPDNTATTTWNYTGPDGTSASFYTISNTNIASIHNGNRYIRYKLILSTEDAAYTPTLANVAFTFTSDCIPPGQADFSGLGSGTYTLDITKTGYTAQNLNLNINNTWQKQSILLSPQ